MPAPQKLTSERWEALVNHRPDLALWLEHQRDATGAGSSLSPDARETLEERGFYAAGEEVLRVLSLITEAGELTVPPKALHVAGRD